MLERISQNQKSKVSFDETEFFYRDRSVSRFSVYLHSPTERASLKLAIAEKCIFLGQVQMNCFPQVEKLDLYSPVVILRPISKRYP